MGFGRNIQRDPEASASASAAMLRELGRVRGSEGAEAEAAAWIVMACASSSPATVERACAEARARGESVDGLAEWAIEADAPLALSWCVENGPMGPATPLRAGRTQHESYAKTLAGHVLARQSVECVKYMEKRFPGLRASATGSVWTAEESDAAAHCAKLSSLHALRALASARGGLSGRDAQEALGWAAAHCGASRSVSDPPEELVAQLVEWGARLDGPADCEGLSEAERGASITLGHVLASRYLSPSKAELKTWEARRAARTAWELVAAQPGWVDWRLPGGPPLGLWALAATCELANDADRSHVADVRRAAREAFGAPACLAALARPMWELALAGDKRGLVAMEGFEQFGDDQVDALAPAEVAAMLARACPGAEKGLHSAGPAIALAAACEKIKGLCQDGAVRESADRARVLCELGVQPAKERDKAREAAMWEALALSLSTFGSGAAPSRAGPRL